MAPKEGVYHARVETLETFLKIVSRPKDSGGSTGAFGAYLPHLKLAKTALPVENEESSGTASRHISPKFLRPIPGSGSVCHAAEHQVRSAMSGAHPTWHSSHAPIAASS